MPMKNDIGRYLVRWFHRVPEENKGYLRERQFTNIQDARKFVRMYLDQEEFIRIYELFEEFIDEDD